MSLLCSAELQVPPTLAQTLLHFDPDSPRTQFDPKSLIEKSDGYFNLGEAIIILELKDMKLRFNLLPEELSSPVPSCDPKRYNGYMSYHKSN